MFWALLISTVVIGSFFAFFPVMRVIGGGGSDNELFNQAQDDINKGDYAGAEKKLRTHLKEDPDNVGSALSLLEVYKVRGKHDGVARVCRQLLSLYEGGRQEFNVYAIHKDFAEVLWSRRKYEEAFFHYVRSLKEDRNSGGLDRLAYALGSQGYYNEAIDLLKECKEKDPKNMQAIRNMIPCYIGIKRPDEARNILLDLLANSASQNKDNYLLGKLFYEMGDRESAQKYFIDFLLNLDASQAGEGQDALILVMSAYYHHPGSLSCRECDVWTRVFQNVLAYVYLNPTQKQEIEWQLGFMLLLRDTEALNFEAARSCWQPIQSLGTNYKNISKLITMLDQRRSREEWLNEYDEFKGQNSFLDTVTVSSTNLKASELFEIPPFQSLIVEEWLNPSLSGDAKHVFSVSEKFNIKELETMSPQQFKTTIQRYLERQGYVVRREIVLDGAGTSLYLQCTNKLNQSVFCSFHRNSGDTGEIELKTAVDQMAQHEIDKALIVSLGSFTEAAKKIAGKNDIELISGASLQANWVDKKKVRD
tara:strand:+ start:7180 stop:8778 length:1599 start_codon:yes stop_codon:yes gene_type:complete